MGRRWLLSPKMGTEASDGPLSGDMLSTIVSYTAMGRRLVWEVRMCSSGEMVRRIAHRFTFNEWGSGLHLSAGRFPFPALYRAMQEAHHGCHSSDAVPDGMVLWADHNRIGYHLN